MPPTRHLPPAVLTLALAAAFALAAGPAWPREIENWPCEHPYVESFSAEEIWGAEPPPANGDWRQDKAVSEVVRYAINPENNPDKGRARITEFAKAMDSGRDAALVNVFHGMLEETNTLLNIAIAGIRNFIIRAKILNEAVQENEAELAALPAEAEKERKDFEVARMWNMRNMDDAEEEAEFICHRISYMKKKLRLLTGQVQTEMGL